MPVLTKVHPKENPADETFGPGFHRAVLTEAALTREEDSLILVFTAAPYRLAEYVSLSERAQKRQIMLARRLGQPVSDADEEAAIDWEKFIGKEYVIEVELDEYTSNDGKEKRRHRLTYAGVWPLNHEDERVVEFLKTLAGKRSAKALAARGAPKPSKPINVDDV